MTTEAPNFRPPWAVTAWLDDTAVYVELPMTKGGVYIQRYALSEGGLTKALNVMRDLRDRERPKNGAYVYPALAPPKSSDPFTDAQRQRARDVLRKMGIT